MSHALRLGAIAFLLIACVTRQHGPSPVPPPCPSRPEVPALNDEAHQRCLCDRGRATGCTRAAVLVHEGFGGPRSPEDAAPLYERGCDGGQAVACRHLALVRLSSRTGGGDEESGVRRLLRRACDGGDGTGCLFLAERLTTGDREARAEADGLFARACELKVVDACGVSAVREAAPLTDDDTADRLSSFVRRHLGELQRCYEVQLQSGHRRPMGVELEFDLEPSRRVGQIEVVSRTAATDTLLECLRERMRTWTTPAVEETITVSHPFIFSPADPPASPREDQE